MDTLEISKELLHQIEKENLNIVDISNHTGLTYNPLYRFLKGNIKQPKISLVLTLLDYLGISTIKGAHILGIEPKSNYLITDENFYLNEDNRNIESLVKTKMQKLRLLNKDIASAISVSPSYLSRVLSSSDGSNFSVVLDLCNVLYISYEELQWCFGFIKEYPRDINYNHLTESNEIDSIYDSNCKRDPFNTIIEYIKKNNRERVGRFISITFHSLSQKDVVKGYILSSKYGTYELGLLMRECIKYMDNLTNVSEGTIDIFQENSNLNARRYFELGSSLHSYSVSELLNKMRQLKVEDKFPYLYVLLKKMETLENK